jgi:hypothetical protein
MSSELLNAPNGTRIDRSLVVAWWVLGILAVSEVIAAAVGLAPKVATTVRKSQAANEPAVPQQAMTPTPSPQPQTTQTPLPVPKAAVREVPRTDAETLDQQTQAPAPFPDNEATDRPFRQPPSDAASPDGAVIEILHADIKGTEGGTKTLQLAIKSCSREAISVPQVKVQVYFYDEQNGEIVPSKAQVTSRWLSAPVDWKNGKPELLEVSYLSDTADPDVRFAGYVVAIYYKGDLQDCRADPPKLKKLFEPKYFIGLDEP